MGRSITVVVVLLSAALLLTTPPADARGRRAVAKSVKHLRGAVKKTPAGRRKNLKLVRRAAKDFRRGRACRGLAKVARLRTSTRINAAIGRLEAAVARSRRARRCQVKSKAAKATATEVQGGGYPAAPLPLPGEDENEQGEELPPLPKGPFRPGAETGDPVDAGAAAAAVTDNVSVFAKTDLGNSGWTGKVQDPSVASAGNVVLVSVNRQLGYSTDAGKTFTYLDPTTLWASQDGGICCDQVLHYAPSVDRFFWLLQYNCSPGCTGSTLSENRYRLALASPSQVVTSGATAWKYFDFTSKTFDEAKQWMDYPDMAIGANSLYFTFNFPRKSAAAWVRIKTSDLVNQNSVGFRYYKKTGDYVLRTVQNSQYRGYVARRKDPSDFEVTHWDDGSIYVYHHNVAFPTPPTKNCGESGPDGVNFLAEFECGGFSQRISGAARRSNGDLWLAWTAGRRIDGQSSDLFPHSHIQLLTVSPSTFNVIRNRAIWNPNYSWSYPGLTASAGGEVAMTYFTGGGTAKYFNLGVGFVTNKESFIRVATGAADKARIGDYLTVRPAAPSSRRFSAGGYVLDATGNFHPWWALFGRSSDAPPPPPPTPTPSPSPSPSPSPTPGPADLVVSFLTSNTVTVLNQGKGPAGPFSVTVVDSQGATLTLQVPNGLAAGASTTLDYDCAALLRSRTATADSGGTVPESDETNNQRSGVFACGG